MNEIDFVYSGLDVFIETVIVGIPKIHANILLLAKSRYNNSNIIETLLNNIITGIYTYKIYDNDCH